VWVALAAVALPLAGSVLVEDWHWPPKTFVMLGMMVFGMAMLHQWASRRRGGGAYAIALGIALAVSFGVLWSTFVHFVDTQRAAALHFAVPVSAVVGMGIARLRPRGMARAMVATASVQGMTMGAVLVTMWVRKPTVASWTGPEWRGLAGNLVSAAMFGVSSMLFRRASRAAAAT
jgi:hypothetical protein